MLSLYSGSATEKLAVNRLLSQVLTSHRRHERYYRSQRTLLISSDTTEHLLRAASSDPWPLWWWLPMIVMMMILETRLDQLLMRSLCVVPGQLILILPLTASSHNWARDLWWWQWALQRWRAVVPAVKHQYYVITGPGAGPGQWSLLSSVTWQGSAPALVPGHAELVWRSLATAPQHCCCWCCHSYNAGPRPSQAWCYVIWWSQETLLTLTVHPYHHLPSTIFSSKWKPFYLWWFI